MTTEARRFVAPPVAEAKEAKEPLSHPCVALLLGPEEPGKSEVMDNLVAMDPRFVRLPFYTDRPQEECPSGGISLSREGFNRLWLEDRAIDRVVTSNGYNSGISKKTTEAILKSGKVPWLDYQLCWVSQLKKMFGDNLFAVYLIPQLPELRYRMAKAGMDESRYQAAVEEIKGLREHKLKDSRIDLRVENNNPLHAADVIKEMLIPRVS